MQTHVKVVAVLFLVFGGLTLMLAFFAPIILSLIAGLVGSSGDKDAALGATILGITGVIASIVLFAFSLPSLICGWGLLKLKPWSRVLGIILAAISLVKIPLGTLFGVYALWVLFNKDTEALLASGKAAT